MSDAIIENNGERRINEAVCIDTRRVYDSCVSKDCLENLRVTFPDDSQSLIDNAVTVKTRDCDIAAVSIDVDEVPFNRGYYSVDINFYFRLEFDTYSAPCTTPQVAVGWANFEKKCILFGSEGDVKIFTSDASDDELDCPEAPQYTNPLAKVQAVDPVVLDTDIVDACHCHCPCCTTFPQSIRETMNNSRISNNGTKAVMVTLGLFSIIQLSRDVQIMIPAYDFCIPERECDCSTQSPCDTFQGIDFPVDEFFPPDREDSGDNGCCNNEE